MNPIDNEGDEEGEEDAGEIGTIPAKKPGFLDYCFSGLPKKSCEQDSKGLWASRQQVRKKFPDDGGFLLLVDGGRTN